mgnify:CR=1 FL=1
MLIMRKMWLYSNLAKAFSSCPPPPGLILFKLYFLDISGLLNSLCRKKEFK